MANLFHYVETYGNINFKEKKHNDIDNLIFSSLAYLNFSNTSINNGKYTLQYIGNEYLEKHSYKEISKLGIAQKEAYKLLKLLLNKERYKNIILSDYVYNINKDIQFSAITFHISKHLKYISFEGTDERISGWKEDCQLACFFPVPAQKQAIQYINQHIKLIGPKVIIGGHSKGGNLALVSAMYMKKWKKWKVQQVYSNDGPGLRKKEFESKAYKKIKKKYIHIIPDCSVIGILLRNDSYKVIKSSKKNILGHSMSTWLIQDDTLISSELSNKSKKLEKSLIKWLDMHDDEQRNKVVSTLFNVLENLGIEDTLNLIKIKNIIKIIHNLKSIDKQTQEVIIDFLTYNYASIKQDQEIKE